MSLNEITDTGAEKIAQTVPFMKKLKKLTLSENEITEDGKDKLKTAITKQK